MPKPLNSRSQELVASLISYFEKEQDNGGPFLPLNCVRERVAAALNIGVNTLTICSNTDILFDVFGKERIPEDIGGDEKSLAELNDILTQKYEEHRDRFLAMEKLSVDEALRPAELKNDELLGYYGNFKKIDVD